jgi:hypothetical protein
VRKRISHKSAGYDNLFKAKLGERKPNDAEGIYQCMADIAEASSVFEGSLD